MIFVSYVSRAINFLVSVVSGCLGCIVAKHCNCFVLGLFNTGRILLFAIHKMRAAALVASISIVGRVY